VLVVGIEVREVGAEEFEQPEVLPRAGERSAAVVGRPHIATQERSRRTRSRGGVRYNGFWGNSARRRYVAAANEPRMRDREVIQSRDMPDRKGQVRRGLAIRRVVGATLAGGARIHRHPHMEGLLNSRYGALDLHVHAITAAAGD